MRERIAKQPFVKFSRFDLEAMIDYGRPYYDNNAKVSGTGVNFGGTKGYLESQKRMAERKKARDMKKAKSGKATAAINDTCPVTGRPVAPGKVASYKGKSIGLCCSGCKSKFEKNPDKYIGDVDELASSKR
jgi:YHS domain-containing protein